MPEPNRPETPPLLDHLPLPDKGIIYVASPLTHPDPRVMQARIEAAAVYTADLISAGEIAFAPVSYSRLLTQVNADPGPAAGFDPHDWYQFDLHFLAIATELRLLTLPGWEQSSGVQLELHCAREWNIPIVQSQPWQKALTSRMPPQKIMLLGEIAT